MEKKDIFNLFPYFKNNKRVNSFLRERTLFFPHCKELTKKSTEELLGVLDSLEKNINSLNKCMANHSKNILSLTAESKLKREIINFVIEAEMKRLCLKQKNQIKLILKNQNKITKYVKK
ncbi:hypothetical protein KO317_00780 [Candidatus Micrarchaeota archaeon]|jgi:hypothetical protein|nr:hypothetical protein [Candidatus Micrarchaeota archaeon]